MSSVSECSKKNVPGVRELALGDEVPTPGPRALHYREVRPDEPAVDRRLQVGGERREAR
jgi:hypothetical protein